MNVKVNFPNKSNLKENKELDKRIAQLDAILIKKYIDNLEIDDKSKNIVLSEVINFFSD